MDWLDLTVIDCSFFFAFSGVGVGKRGSWAEQRGVIGWEIFGGFFLIFDFNFDCDFQII